MDLKEKKCVPCEGDTAPFDESQIQEYLLELQTDWRVLEENCSTGIGARLRREFKFKDFQEALDFVNKVGEIAEQENHHPDIALAWGKVGITLTTHAINGLSENDFILAAKIDSLN